MQNFSRAFNMHLLQNTDISIKDTLNDHEKFAFET